MATGIKKPTRPPLGSERPPWTVMAAAAICGATALVSAVVTGDQLWQYLHHDRPRAFFSLPDTLFAESTWIANAAYLLIVVPWTVAVVTASVRLLLPHRSAHVHLGTLLAPALGFDVMAYVAVLVAGQPIGEAHVPFGLWFGIGIVVLLLLSHRGAREFEGRLRSERGEPWSDELLDDGT